MQEQRGETRWAVAGVGIGLFALSLFIIVGQISPPPLGDLNPDTPEKFYAFVQAAFSMLAFTAAVYVPWRISVMTRRQEQLRRLSVARNALRHGDLLGLIERLSEWERWCRTTSEEDLSQNAKLVVSVGAIVETCLRTRELLEKHIEAAKPSERARENLSEEIVKTFDLAASEGARAAACLGACSDLLEMFSDQGSRLRVSERNLAVIQLVSAANHLKRAREDYQAAERAVFDPT